MANILYVEDTEDNQILVTRRLTRKGHAIDIANSAEEAFSRLKETLPDLILMDVGLPGMDGWTAATRLKSDPKTAPIPIIALTAHAMQGDREQSMNAGCDDYETKPFDFIRLSQKIESLLEK